MLCIRRAQPQRQSLKWYGSPQTAGQNTTAGQTAVAWKIRNMLRKILPLKEASALAEDAIETHIFSDRTCYYGSRF